MVDKKPSKFKNLHGEVQKLVFEEVKPMNIITDGQLLDANSQFAAVCWHASGGGKVAILDPLFPTRVPNNISLIKHQHQVCDLRFNPFCQNLLSTVSENIIQLWKIPEGGLTEDLESEYVKVSGHTKKILLSSWNPYVANVISTGSFDRHVNVWDINNQNPIYSFELPEVIMSLDWSRNGSLIGCTSKDKKANIIDPRSNKIETNFVPHDSTKISRITFINNTLVLTIGFSKENFREMKLWDLRNLNEEVQNVHIDTQSGVIQPHYDEDTGLIFCPGRGEGNIKYYEFSNSSIKFLNEFKTNTGQKATCIFPKRTMNYLKSEIIRVGKLTNNSLEFISFSVPKRNEGYYSDLYPNVVTGEDPLSVDEWINKEERDIGRKPIDKIENKWINREKVEVKEENNEVKETVDVSELKKNVIEYIRKTNQQKQTLVSLEDKLLKLKTENQKLAIKI